MERRDFIAKISLGAAFALTFSCLGACSKDNEVIVLPNGTSTDFEIDLTDSANAALLNSGGYIIKNKVVVAKDNSGANVAATQICSHENKPRVILKNNQWYCPEHGAKFDLSGNGLNNDAKRGLTIYKTALNGNLLRVFS